MGLEGALGQMAGIPRHRAFQLAGREDFSKPAAVLATRRVWKRRDLKRWIEEWDRTPGRPPKALAAPTVRQRGACWLTRR
jgi:hypothetical protein